MVWSLIDENGSVLANGDDLLDVDVRDLIARRIRLEEVDALVLTGDLAASASDPANLSQVEAAVYFDPALTGLPDDGGVVAWGTFAAAAEGHTPDVRSDFFIGDVFCKVRGQVPTGGATIGSPVTVRVEAYGSDGAALPATCDLDLTEGSTCEAVADGGGSAQVRVDAIGTDGTATLVVRTTGLADDDGDGQLELPVAPLGLAIDGAAENLATSSGGPVYSGSAQWSFAALTDEQYAAWSESGALLTLRAKDPSGATVGVLAMKAQFGEILIDGVVWELE